MNKIEYYRYAVGWINRCYSESIESASGKPLVLNDKIVSLVYGRLGSRQLNEVLEYLEGVGVVRILDAGLEGAVHYQVIVLKPPPLKNGEWLPPGSI